ncbi:MAG: GntR family transcriptional regulator [Candidatus Izemoplasma sp.]|nr:GntR family transcriptional regulator [Candidatus Izemoplasma sp.]
MKEPKNLAKHVQIAYEIAQKINQNILQEGDKLRGRNLAATEYKVSSETVRKALALLQQKGVVIVKEQSGAFVLSVEYAKDFVKAIKEDMKLSNHVENIKELLKENKAITKQIEKEFRLIDLTKRKSTTDLPFDIFSFKVTKNCQLIGKTMQECAFFHNTGATLFGMIKNKQVISSVPNSTVIDVDDILFFSGDEKKKAKTLTYIKDISS